MSRTRQGWSTAGGIVLVAAVIVLGCVVGFDDFFFVDDAQNEYLPFFYEMGRLWRAGDLPLVTTRSWFGGNMLLDMALSPFAPQTIVASILAASSASRMVPVLAFAWMNVTLVVLSGSWLGRIYALRGRWALLLGFVLATQPVFLYIFGASWWNNASGYAWFLFALAAQLQLRRTLTASSFVLAAAGACALFTTATTHFQLVYALLCALVLAADLREHRSLRRAAVLAIAPASALLVSAIPLMAEYILSAEWVTRSSGWDNAFNALVPNWGMLLNTFNPFYGSYMGWFTDLAHVSPSLGYSTALLFFALAFFRWKTPDSFEQKLLAPLAWLAFVLCFLPSQAGPMRYPLRFLAVLALPLSIYALQRVANGTPRIDRKRLQRVAVLIAVVTVLTFFSTTGNLLSLDPVSRLVLVPALFGGAAWALVRSVRNGEPRQARFTWAASVSFLSWFLALLLAPTIGGINLPHAVLAEPGTIRPTGRPGYVVSLCERSWDSGRPEHLSQLVSGRFLMYGQPAINGYSPAGHKGLKYFFPYRSSHGFFHPKGTIAAITRPAPGLAGVTMHQLFQVSDVFACSRDIDAATARLMADAGFEQVHAELKDGRVWFRAANQLASVGSLLRLPGSEGVTAAGTPGARLETFDLPPASEARRLHFARLYWPGYSASLDGKPLPLRPYLNTTLEVEVPPGAAGRLTLHYVPVSWRFTRWSLLAGLLLIALTAATLARRRALSPIRAGHADAGLREADTRAAQPS